MPRIISKSSRVLVVIGLLAATSFAVGGLVYAMSAQADSQLETATDRLETLKTIANDVTTSIGDEQAALDDYVLSRSPGAEQRFNVAVASESTAMAGVGTTSSQLSEAEAALAALHAVNLDWLRRVASPAVTAVKTNDQSALDTFIARSAAGEDPFADAAGHLANELAAAETDLQNRSSTTDALTTLGAAIALSFLVVAFGVAIVVVRRYGTVLELDARHASVLSRFTEVTSFAEDDKEVAASNLVALGRLVAPDASVVHILNRSMDRAIPESTTGDALAEILPLHALNRCAGVARGSVYLADDLADELSVR